MSHDRSSVKFTIIAVITLLGAGAGLAALWPAAQNAAHDESARLVEAGKRTFGPEAANDFLLATWLDSSNHQAFSRLANAQIATGAADEALVSLDRAGEGSEVEQLKIRTLIELGRYNEAASEAGKLAQPGHSDSDILLAALALAAADRQLEATALMDRVSSPEAAGRIAHATASQVTLGAELYASGLLNSSGAVLAKLPVSYERNLLMAHIRYQRQTKNDLIDGVQLLTAATQLNPSGLEARELLAKIYRQQNQPADANNQDVFITKLKNGRP